MAQRGPEILMRAIRNGLICNGSFGRSTTLGGSKAYDEGSIPFTRSNAFLIVCRSGRLGQA
jgi:hypothetical protein